MDGDETDVEPAQPDSFVTLHELYKSTQDHLIATIERSLDSDRKELAGKLDDVLLRQRFWEDDIQFEDGALSRLDAYDAVASFIIRHYLDEISRLLYAIVSILSEQSRCVSILYVLLHLPTVAGFISLIDICLAAIVAQLIVTSISNHEKEEIALLHKTNARLCDQVEIFEAMAANDAADAAWDDCKATAITRLRRKLEEENMILQSRTKS